ncbi:hypothetical protein [Robertmurraya sp. FSL R5-0851]|uniref:hypothetical protein n=1 Tax=Robertmurraya sp. FSL R5-0851 TaxID=2921584 RepID=UPI0030FABED8
MTNTVDENKKVKIRKNNLDKYYSSKGNSENKRQNALKILERFDQIYDAYLLGFNSFFKDYPTSYSIIKQGEEAYEDQKRYKSMDIDEKALGIIYNLIGVIYTIKYQIQYFDSNIKSAQYTLEILENDTEIKEFFPYLYHIRRNNLEKLIWHSQKIIGHLNDQLIKYQSAIDELSKIKKKSLLSKAAVFAWNMVSAPVRHIVNLVEGIVYDDDAKVNKSVMMLIFGTVGIGLLSDAIDALDVLDSLDYNSLELVEGPNNHFVEPHSRMLSDGNTIWVDGDGDTSIDRTVEEGGGYLRSNPDGNPYNNLKS